VTPFDVSDDACRPAMVSLGSIDVRPSAERLTTRPVGFMRRPACFAAFLADRGTRKPSTHTVKAYRQDFDAIA
jgi:hypothetical protein